MSDDLRLLRLLRRHAPTDASVEETVAPLATLFGTEATAAPGGLWRVADEAGASVCLGAPLPGERERPCELVTAPLEDDVATTLSTWLGLAGELGFTVPLESAVHVHFDATPLRDARVLQRLAVLWLRLSSAFRERLATNPNCRRLGGWKPEVVACLTNRDFADLPFDAARARLREAGVTKYCDLNLANLALDLKDKPTIELRVLPGGLDAAPMVAGACLGAALLRAAVDGTPVSRLEELEVPSWVWSALPAATTHAR